ncbi:MAG: cob(I)yrinic acid a,c-diamide adenosyltransferase [Phycisphaerae bacterium]
MTIYTKVGDAGDTYRPGNVKARKGDLAIEAVGSVDELDAAIGLCLARAKATAESETLAALSPVQGELLAVGANVAAAGTGSDPHKPLDESAIVRMEKQIDRIWSALPELRHFVIPGGSELACRLHLARTICRRCERDIVRACDGGMQLPPAVLQYVNRLSSLLFTLSRWANHHAGEGEVQWPG